MLLSEAIRLGAMLRPQAFGGLFVNGGSCANGAALEAFGCKIENSREAWKACPYALLKFQESFATHPVLKHQIEVSHIIVDLNNRERWTRERIADWVESIERERGLIPDRESALIAQTEGMLDCLAKVAR